MKPFLADRPSVLRKATATAVCVLLGAVVPGCGSASDAYVPLRPARSIPLDGVTYAYIGRQALAQYGYEEIIAHGADPRVENADRMTVFDHLRLMDKFARLPEDPAAQDRLREICKLLGDPPA